MFIRFAMRRPAVAVAARPAIVSCATIRHASNSAASAVAAYTPASVHVDARAESVRLRNTHLQARTTSELLTLRGRKWELWDELSAAAPLPLTIDGRAWALRPGLTFTPYANAVPCNAHCGFCSEDLRREHLSSATLSTDTTAQRRRIKANSKAEPIRNYDRYFDGLQRCIDALQPLKLGLSLSGLEATAEPEWFLRMMQFVIKNDARFDEKVLYSNGSGFAADSEFEHYLTSDSTAATATPAPLLRAFMNARFDRIELSRQHFDDATNQRVMRFERSQPVQHNARYEWMVRHALVDGGGTGGRAVRYVKNSCILTATGIHDLSGVESYARWASALGVSEIVFRELSRFSETEYAPNATRQWVDANRVPIEPLLTQVCTDLKQQRNGWAYQYSVCGYYYFNEHYQFDVSTPESGPKTVEVIFESSSYVALSRAIARDPNLVNKLIFHSNGNLTGDWQSESNVIANFFPPATAAAATATVTPPDKRTLQEWAKASK